MNPEPPSLAGDAANAAAAASPAAPPDAAAVSDAAPASVEGQVEVADSEPAAVDDAPAEPLPTGSSVAAPMASAAEPATESLVESPAEPTDGATPASAAAPAAPAPTPDLSPAATGSRLAALFPALFVGPDGKGVWKPIKLRIHADIQARAPGQFSKRTLGIFFSRYTTTTPYLKALAADGAQRFDLDGQPAGEISDEHRQLAAEEVARRQAIAAERRAAFRPPRREPPPMRAAPHAGSVATGAEGPPNRRPLARPGEHDEARARRSDERPGAAPPPPREGGPRPDRPPRRIADAPRSLHPARPPRRSEPAAQGARPQRPEHLAPPLRREPPATPALPSDPVQRERAMLLRAFESSPLSKANFCALKGLTEATLDAALAQAQAERGAPSHPAAPRHGNGR